jgi:predicted adenine nucleotide alpha hydrolase (AANH) superfamily ATPase
VTGNKLLLHACCAHCAAYTVGYWRHLGYEVAALWYNPNIHPFTEHEKRREGLVALCGHLGLPLYEEPDYDMPAFLKATSIDPKTRCEQCFRLRLSRTARRTREMGFDAFSTTLLISPHQKHEILRDSGEEIARDSGVLFLYADLRKSYQESRRLTKPLDIYRQQWCGCLFSEWERYHPTSKH